jgi:small redox-active disulfide protein 2
MLTIKVVGPGCMNCRKLAQLCEEVVAENNIEAEIEKVTDINRFAELGIMMTPGLILNDKVISSGKMPTRATLAEWLTANQ